MEDNPRIQNIEEAITRIEHALLGAVTEEGTTVGLLEKQRNHEREIGELLEFKASMEPKVEEALSFKRNITKIVAGIATIIPIVFEVFKYGGGAIWELFKNHTK